MSSYNNRRWSMTLDGEPFIEETEGRQFKCTFEILHDFGGYTSYADVALYNLSTDTANKAFTRGTVMSFRGGYADSIDTLFTGTINNVLRERVGPDTITRLICRGGKLVDNQTQINETLGKNAKVTDIIKACVKVMGYPITMKDADFSDIDPYAFGYVLSGDPRAYMDELARAHDFEYVIENQRMIVVRKGYSRQGEVQVVSQFTGMEGIPEITERGVDVTVRLNPKLSIGGMYRLESDLATFNFGNLYFVDIPKSAGVGEYKIHRLNHTGDSYGDSWSSKITGYREVLTSSS